MNRLSITAIRHFGRGSFVPSLSRLNRNNSDPICWREFCVVDIVFRMLILKSSLWLNLTTFWKRWPWEKHLMLFFALDFETYYNVEVDKFIMLMLRENRWIENKNVEIDKFVMLMLRENRWMLNEMLILTSSFCWCWENCWFTNKNVEVQSDFIVAFCYNLVTISK